MCVNGRTAPMRPRARLLIAVPAAPPPPPTTPTPPHPHSLVLHPASYACTFAERSVHVMTAWTLTVCFLVLLLPRKLVSVCR